MRKREMDFYSCSHDGHKLYIDNNCETGDSPRQTKIVTLDCTQKHEAIGDCSKSSWEKEKPTVQDLQKLNYSSKCVTCCQEICYVSLGNPAESAREPPGHVYIITASVVGFTFLILLILLAVYIRRSRKTPVRRTRVVGPRRYSNVLPPLPTGPPPPLPPPRVSSSLIREDISDNVVVHSPGMVELPDTPEGPQIVSMRTSSFSSVESEQSVQKDPESETLDAKLNLSDQKSLGTRDSFTNLQNMDAKSQRPGSTRKTSFSSLQSEFKTSPLSRRASQKEELDVTFNISETIYPARHDYFCKLQDIDDKRQGPTCTRKESFCSLKSESTPLCQGVSKLQNSNAEANIAKNVSSSNFSDITRFTSNRPLSTRKSSFSYMDTDPESTPHPHRALKKRDSITNESVTKSPITRAHTQRAMSSRKTVSSLDSDVEKKASHRRRFRKSKNFSWLEEHEVRAILEGADTRTTPPPLPPRRRSTRTHSCGSGSAVSDSDCESGIFLLGLEPAFNISRLVRDIENIPVKQRKRTTSASSAQPHRQRKDQRPSSML
ncbi:hypothetical protein BgiBS90_029966 [Biomphalaria glabrata]|nr:hypothetical protein BgiBS90_029966 [Biomphalaria glabrata]